MSEIESADQRRRLPSVSRVLEEPRLRALGELYGSAIVTSHVRDGLDDLRRQLQSDAEAVASGEELLAQLVEVVAADVESLLGRRLGRMLNATGIFLHTNLGRAPLPPQVAAGLPRLLDAYCDLEIERDTGKRGDRNRRAARLLCALTGAESALVVNNNAAAMVLALSTLARDREVIVSRGELVEIGGSFRVPEILEASGARLVEVGSTNRTRPDDYRRGISDDTGLLLKVHPSNYRISGFTASVSLSDLVEIARDSGVPVMVDEGSGLLLRHPAEQLRDHDSLSEILSRGCDLTCGSGDKLLGGPQAGLLLGRREIIESCHRNPLYRALRPDRACFAALEAVLRLHLAAAKLPIDRLWSEEATQRRRLERVRQACGGEIVGAEAYVGGGAAPEAPIAGWALTYPGQQRLLARLRAGEPPIVGYVRDDRVILDLRTVDPADDEALIGALSTALGREGAA